MRKLWLTFTAMLLCSIASFAQTEISTKEQFMAIQANGNYILMNDINLGDFGEREASIISSFSGTFNGNGKTITYQASFKKNTTANNDWQAYQEKSDHSLFGSVSGTIRNLNVNANVTLSGTANNMNVALICGTLKEDGVIEYCNASGNVNSTVNPKQGGGSDAGLLVGESAGTVRYCTGYGNVVGAGYVGGLIGQMKRENYRSESPTIMACSFVGAVTAVSPTQVDLADGYGSFAGGICGHADNYSIISFCVADGTITSGWVSSGIVSVNTSDGRATVTYTSADGEIIVTETGNNTVSSNTTNSTQQNNTGNYYGQNPSAQDIVNALEAARISAGHNEFYFDVVNGHVVLIIGQRPVICNAPTNLQVNVTDYTAAISWDAPEGATQFRVSHGGGSIISGSQPTLTTSTVEGNTFTMNSIMSGSSYIVKVETICGNDSYSEPVSISFTTSCPSVSNLAVNNITHETATATWGVSAETIFKVRLYEGNNTNSQYISEDETNSLTTINLSGLEPATQYTIEVLAHCGNNYVEGNNATVTFTTKPINFETAQSGNFNDPNTWEGNVVPAGNVANITINTGHKVTVSHNLMITEDYKIDVNNGVLQITQLGQLINTSDVNVPGIVEIVSPQKSMNKWTFIGAPFENGYKLGTIYPMSHDISVSKYNYSTANWSESWAHVETQMEAGEGYFAWPFYDGAVIFTTFGDVWNYTTGTVGEYVYGQTTTALNNANEITITKDITENNGRWMALSNPYPAKLSVSEFATDTDNNIQGQGIYRLTNRDTTVNGKVVQAYDYVVTEGNIAMTEGFFVNLASGSSSVTFKKDHLTDYEAPTTQAKSQVAPREFVELSLVKGNYKSKLYFAHNQEAEQNYDIFDANKLFALGEVAEPYFVTDGIALVKEEAKELPYYATMNVRSFANDTVSFVVNNIPEGLAVSIIDGENVIDMVEGGVYTTEILTGENADRFKVLIKKSVSISDVEELEVNITNNNRHISIETTETDLQVEVYNALGQKVFSTKDRNFTLNQVSAGAYLIKAFNNKASKTQKIVVE